MQREKRFKTTSLSVLFLSFFCVWGLYAQKGVNSSFGNVTGSGGTVSYSIGQVADEVYKESGGTISQGVQQAYEISVVTGTEQANGISLDCLVYPNPTSNFLFLHVETDLGNNLSYKLYDIGGKILESHQLTGNETKIEVQHLVPASYFLKVTEGNIEIKTFKIIKR